MAIRIPAFSSFFWLFCFFLAGTSPLLAQQTATEWFYQGKLYADMGDIDRAITAYDQAIVLSPDFAGAYSNRGVARMSKQDYEEAVKDLQKSIDLGFPIPTIPWYNLGLAYEQLGRCSEAYQAFVTARDTVVLQPENYGIDLNAAIQRIKMRCRA